MAGFWKLLKTNIYIYIYVFNSGRAPGIPPPWNKGISSDHILSAFVSVPVGLKSRRQRNMAFAHGGGSLVVCYYWAVLGEDKLINLAPMFSPIFGPLWPAAGPGSLGTGSGWENNARCTKNQLMKPIIRPARGYFVFLVPAAKT